MITTTATFTANGDGSFQVQIGPTGFIVWPRDLKAKMRQFDVVESFFYQAIQALSQAGIDPDNATLTQIGNALKAVQFVIEV